VVSIGKQLVDAFGFQVLRAIVEFPLAGVQRFNELIKKLRQTLRIFLVRYQLAEVSPLLLFNAHSLSKGKNMAKFNTWARDQAACN